MTDGESERDQALEEIVEISASARAKKLRLHEPSSTEVARGKATTKRRGLPPTGAKAGVDYRDIEVSTRIKGRPKDD